MLTWLLSLPFQPDGRLMEGSPSANDDGFSTFFSETGSGKHVPRSLYVRSPFLISDQCLRANVSLSNAHMHSSG